MRGVPATGATPALVLDLVRASRSVSRVELAERCGLTAATITHAVRELLDAGLLHEAERAPSRGGSPRRMLRLTHDAHYAVGVQMDRSSSTVVVTDFTGTVLAQSSLVGAGDNEPSRVLTWIADHIIDLIASAGVPRTRVLGVGFVTHGPQDRGRGRLLTAQPTAAWFDFPLTDVLARAVGIPVLLENDATAAAIGEQWAGALPTSTFGVVYMATGIGGAVVVDSHAYRGRSSNTAEIGHVTLDPAGPPCVCGNRGCVQVTAAPPAVVARALTDRQLAADLRLIGTPDAHLADFERLARGAVHGDARARALLGDAAGQLGQSAVTMANLFDLDTVVLAGPAFTTAGPLYRERIQELVSTRSHTRTLSPPRVLLSDNVASAAAIGGALVVLRDPQLRARATVPLTTERTDSPGPGHP
jgi:predicted NBD/HSP70 family sugar kinase